MTRRYSVAMTGLVNTELTGHLLRADGQEDVCLALYAVSTGATRTTALLREVLLPEPGERDVHKNASFTCAYVLRAVEKAAAQGLGVAILHSHPGARGWQWLSRWDDDAESSYALFVEQHTGLPLVGLTLAGRDRIWSARFWTTPAAAAPGPAWCENVRVVGEKLDVSWNGDLVPPPIEQPSQVRTVSAWGSRQQADLVRLKILVVGLGSVGLDVALRLAAAGFSLVGVNDHDIVTELNRDRMIGVTREDAALGRLKVDVAARLMLSQATAEPFMVEACDLPLYKAAAHARALDYDLVISCVDRPWARAVLNTLAYADLIPVVDGGISIEAFDDGSGMRSATWRAHLVRSGAPCLACNLQLDPALVPLERAGLLDDPKYLEEAGMAAPARQNVALLCPGPISGILSLLVSYTVAPGGQGDPGPLQFSLAVHELEHLSYRGRAHCAFENSTAMGDRRLDFTEP